LTTTGLGQALATGLGQALTIAAARQVARHGLLALLVAGEAPQPLVRTLSSFGRRKGVLPRGVLDADTLGGARLRSYLAELRSPCRLLGPPPPPPRGACVRVPPPPPPPAVDLGALGRARGCPGGVTGFSLCARI
jgi:hypothetical protein